jgi:hypothetical protein
MNAAEMVQQRPQQMFGRRCPTADPGHRKFHCVFKGSRAR